MSKSAITPCRSGRLAEIVAGVRPIIRFASSPTAYTLPLLESVATTEGSESTIPRPRTYTSVFAVPRSIARSRPALLSEERKLSGSAGGKRRGERRPVDVVAPTVAVSGRVPGEVDGEYRGKARVGRAPVTGDRVRAYVVAVGVGVDVEGRAGRGRDAVGDAVVRDRDSERAVARDLVVRDVVRVDGEHQDSGPDRNVADLVLGVEAGVRLVVVAHDVVVDLVVRVRLHV